MLPLKLQPTFNCLTSYAIETIDKTHIQAIGPYFKNLPTDLYLEGDYRFRRFSRFKVVQNELIHLPHHLFYQSKIYNPLLGNVPRDYQELDETLIQLDGFKAAVLTFFEFCQLCSIFTEIGVHQIRITTSEQQQGSPAPEGIHQDGVDLVGVLCIDRHQVLGGITQLFADQDGSPVFSKILNPGELLVFNDHQFFHYTTEISPSKVTANGNDIGTRDVFVFTCPDRPFERYE